MNAHLSASQVSAALSGERCCETDLHLAHCAACRGEIAALEASLLRFRGEIRSWSAAHFTAGRPLAARQPARSNALGFAMAVTALLILISLSVAGTVRRSRALDACASDAALLNRLHGDIARTVPRSMEPLTRLVFWGDGDERPVAE